MKKVYHKIRVGWGITGSGDKLLDVIEIMKIINAQYFNELDITVYLSKAGELVLKYYKKLNEIKREFKEIGIEVNSNNPSLGLQLQTGKYDFLLIAPATSNTVAKIAMKIAKKTISILFLPFFLFFIFFYRSFFLFIFFQIFIINSIYHTSYG